MHYMFASLLIVYYEYYFQIIDKTYMIYLSYVYVKKVDIPDSADQLWSTSEKIMYGSDISSLTFTVVTAFCGVIYKSPIGRVNNRCFLCFYVYTYWIYN